MAKQAKPHKPKNTPVSMPTEKQKRGPILLPTTPVFFLLLWAWGWLWYGEVLHTAREYSFWAPDDTLMYFLEGRSWGLLCWVGRALLQFYKWPVLGSAVLALLIGGCTWLLGYCLRLRGWWRLLQYLPAGAYLGIVAYVGFDLYFEAETGQLLGIPTVCFAILLMMALVIRSFSHSHKFPNLLFPPKDETVRQNYAQLAIGALVVAVSMGITQQMRPYVPVVAKMQCQMEQGNWRGMAETARQHNELSYRQIAAYYAIALTQTDDQCSRLFDIRLDYDDPYIHSWSGGTNGENYYLMDCDLYAGLVQTAIHHAMEQMTMNGPSLHTLKVLTKCALLKGEWKVAEKYLTILDCVPFESDFVKRYRPMVGKPERVDADAEFQKIRLTEPMHDNFENFLVQPVFLGYNSALSEGRSMNALWNSLAVHIYTKSMPQFMMRVPPLAGTNPPQNVAEALLLMSGKYPQALQMFPTIEYNRQRLAHFMQDVKPYVGSFESRSEHARELFPKWKGYYPYYYFFGNLKATKRSDDTEKNSSKQGVN